MDFKEKMETHPLETWLTFSFQNLHLSHPNFCVIWILIAHNWIDCLNILIKATILATYLIFFFLWINRVKNFNYFSNSYFTHHNLLIPRPSVWVFSISLVIIEVISQYYKFDRGDIFFSISRKFVKSFHIILVMVKIVVFKVKVNFICQGGKNKFLDFGGKKW